MSQQTHVIDIRRPFIPADPNTLADTYHNTQQEDSPEPRIPVVPYDMANCMPTHQGYASYFGINSNLGINTLVTSGGSGNVDDLFMIQTNEFVNILVALCDDGIWVKNGGTSGNWSHTITLTPPATGQHRNWTKCVIDNVVHVYRQNESYIWSAGPATSYVFTQATPNTLNMAAQLGIFKAGGRLGFWDSENSTAWSALGDVTDFVPSQRTLAGAAIFQDIVGRIVMVRAHGTGFIIYATKSIIHVQRIANAPSLFSGRAIFNNNGISYRNECCTGEPDTQHYAMTTQGFVEISNGEAKFEIPEISTYLKEKREPVYLHLLNGRYLFLPFLNPYYANGIAQFQTQPFSSISYTFKGASFALEEAQTIINPRRAFFAAMTAHEGSFLFDTYGFRTIQEAAEGYDTDNEKKVPIWEDNLNTLVPIALLEAWKATGTTGMGDPDYFDNKYTAEGGIVKISTGIEYMIPTGMVPVADYTFQANMHVEANTRDFYNKQDWLWYAESVMYDHWKKSLSNKTHNAVEQTFTNQYTSALAADDEITTTKHTFGPYIDLSFFSEVNRYYGKAEKSAWLQRSLAQLVYLEVDEILHGSNGFTAAEVKWKYLTENVEFAGDISIAAIVEDHDLGLTDAGVAYADLLTTVTALIAQWNIDANPPSDMVILEILEAGVDNPVADVANGISAGQRYYKVFINNAANEYPNNTSYILIAPVDGVTSGNRVTSMNLQTLKAVYKVNGTIRQEFGQPKFKYAEAPTCTYKELGYTQITGHGHYTLLGDFVEDDDTNEDADYTDACDGNPNKKKEFLFNGTPIPATPGFAYSPQAVTINAVTYSFPDEVVTIPGGENFIQTGSIEPVYPTFIGAFVYDLHYKKWGKMVQNWKQLLDYFPINNVAGDSPIPYDTFLPKGAMLAEDGNIYFFDQFPNTAFITFGKYGQYRKGFTDVEELRVQNRTPMSGNVTIAGSLDGNVIELGLSETRPFENARLCEEGFTISARWYNLTVEGNFDITNLEVRSSRKGKR